MRPATTSYTHGTSPVCPPFHLTPVGPDTLLNPRILFSDSQHHTHLLLTAILTAQADLPPVSSMSSHALTLIVSNSLSRMFTLIPILVSRISSPPTSSTTSSPSADNNAFTISTSCTTSTATTYGTDRMSLSLSTVRNSCSVYRRLVTPSTRAPTTVYNIIRYCQLDERTSLTVSDAPPEANSNTIQSRNISLTPRNTMSYFVTHSNDKVRFWIRSCLTTCMEGGPSNQALVDAADSLLLFSYAFAIFAMLMHLLLYVVMMMQAPCALLVLSFFDHGKFVKPQHYMHPQGLLNYTPYFLVVAHINTVHKLLDTNLTLTCPPTLPYDKGIGFS